jgi:glycerol transport system ATP-binding protein
VNGHEINAISGEGDVIPEGANRITFAPEGVNVYANDWRISPQGKAA